VFEIDGNSMDIPSGNEFLSLLLMDLDNLTPNTETLLGTLDFTIPISADTEDIYYIYTQGSSGTSSNYDVIVFEDTFIGVVPILANIPGDFNQDSSVDVLDIVMIVDLILYTEDPSEYEVLLGDLNDDGGIDVVDIVILVALILDNTDYNSQADLNLDGSINVVDIVMLIDWILNPPTEGCTEPNAENYCADCLIDDGSCSYATIQDIDGNTYETVEIGNQTWMAENLKTTRYKNGAAITNIYNNSEWSGLTVGAYGDYDNNNDLYAEAYGRLYNWHAAMDDRGICMDSWHVPSDVDWQELEIFLGMEEAPADDVGFRGIDQGSQLAENLDLSL
jgi:uncharacterized protein (TIGR02145 family)